MMAKGLVLRGVALLCGDKRRVGRLNASHAGSANPGALTKAKPAAG